MVRMLAAGLCLIAAIWIFLKTFSAGSCSWPLICSRSFARAAAWSKACVAAGAAAGVGVGVGVVWADTYGLKPGTKTTAERTAKKAVVMTATTRCVLVFIWLFCLTDPGLKRQRSIVKLQFGITAPVMPRGPLSVVAGKAKKAMSD